eukprot:1156560-Pelagomonas_calceolata.AAC.5
MQDTGMAHHKQTMNTAAINASGCTPQAELPPFAVKDAIASAFVNLHSKLDMQPHCGTKAAGNP